MTIQMTAGALASGLKLLSGVVEHRVTFPVLGCFELSNGKLFGSNLDVDVEVEVPASGKAVLPPIEYRGVARLARLIDGDETLTIEPASPAKGRHEVELRFNGSRYQLPHADSELPRLDMPADAVATQAGNLGLLAAMRRVAPFISTEETRYYLNGICLSRGPDGAPCVVATDGHRLAWMPTGAVAMAEGESDPIIPRDALKVLLAQKAEPGTVQFGALRTRFEWPGLRLTAKLIDGTYPDFRRVIPKFETAPALEVELPRGAMLAALRRLSVMSDVSSRPVKTWFSADGLQLSMLCDGQSFEETVALAGPAAEHVSGFNAGYLIQVLRSFPNAEVIRMYHEEPGAPAMFTADGDALTVVLMPMRVWQ